MPSRQSTIPRIRVDLPDNLPYRLSPSSTLDIKDALSQAKLLPMLLAEDSVFDDADDALYFEDGRLLDFPSFPMGRQPSLFILNSHRARLPFHIRPDAFELGDFCRDEEDIRPLLTAPTVPRMKMVIMERLYVQKWVDVLMPDNPPKHIPWTCEKPATKTDWIAEGSVFPAYKVKSTNHPIEQRGVVQEHPYVTDADRFSIVVQASHSRELDAFPGTSSQIHGPTDFHTSTHVRTKSADVDPGIHRGRRESKSSHTSHRPVMASEPVASLLSAASGTPDVPLAARRGQSLSGLKLKAGIIEHLEYPDIPTAFRGSPIVWSPRCDAFHIPSFTDHESMLLDLKSKCAALGSGLPLCIQEPLDSTRTSLNSDEWVFTRGLSTFDNSFLGPVGRQIPGVIAADTSAFLPDDASTPIKDTTARFKFAPRPHSTPAAQSAGNRSSDPPRIPLPPRPALINPSTPPQVRGILKKVKSVRFEDVTSSGHTSPVSPPSQVSPERPSPLPVAVPPERACTPMPKIDKSSNDQVLDKETLGMNIQKKPTSRSRPPPNRAKVNDPGNPSGPSKPTPATRSNERPCRIALAKENANLVTGPRTQVKQKGLSVAEVDIRRGIEGTTKNRLSTPLRNIFRFR